MQHASDMPDKGAVVVGRFAEQLDPEDVVLVLDKSGRISVFDGSLNQLPVAKDKQISTGSRLKRAIDIRAVEGSCVLWLATSGSVYTAYELPDSHPYCRSR